MLRITDSIRIDRRPYRAERGRQRLSELRRKVTHGRLDVCRYVKSGTYRRKGVARNVSESLADFIDRLTAVTVEASESDWTSDLSIELPPGMVSNLQDLARFLERDLDSPRVKQVSGVLLVGGSAAQKQLAASTITGALKLRSHIVDAREIEALEPDAKAARFEQMFHESAHFVVLLYAEAIVSQQFFDAIDRRPKMTLLVGTTDDRTLTEGPLARHFKTRMELTPPADGAAPKPGFRESLRSFAKNVGFRA